jgi:hypothetical protein
MPDSPWKIKWMISSLAIIARNRSFVFGIAPSFGSGAALPVICMWLGGKAEIRSQFRSLLVIPRDILQTKLN